MNMKNKHFFIAIIVVLLASTVYAQIPAIDMVHVQGGEFLMGCTDKHSDCSINEAPAHPVKLNGYYIAKYEVTQELWMAVMGGKNPSKVIGDSLPVTRVSWYDAQTFIGKLNQLTGKKYRLPTEAEWEYAARGGNLSKNYRFSGSNTLEDVAWCKKNSDNVPHVVGTRQPNELGIYDMTGNVFEWCQDYYGDYDMMPAESPTGPESGETRVRRGGNWGGSTHGTRVSFRIYELENIRYNYIGLRLAATTIPDDNVALTSAPSISESQQPKNGKRYNVMGQPADANYKGIVIEDGAKILVK